MQVNPYTERRRTEANGREQRPMVVKMVVKNRRSDLRKRGSAGATLPVAERDDVTKGPALTCSPGLRITPDTDSPTGDLGGRRVERALPRSPAPPCNSQSPGDRVHLRSPPCQIAGQQPNADNSGRALPNARGRPRLAHRNSARRPHGRRRPHVASRSWSPDSSGRPASAPPRARRTAHRRDPAADRRRPPARRHGTARPQSGAHDYGHLQARHAAPRSGGG